MITSSLQLELLYVMFATYFSLLQYLRKRVYRVVIEIRTTFDNYSQNPGVG